MRPNDLKDRKYRVPLQIMVAYEADNRKVTMFCSNLSVGGVFVETTTPAPVGSKLEISFALPNGMESFSVHSKVIWHRVDASGEQPPGMGLEFENVDEKTSGLIKKAIALFRRMIDE